MYGVDQPPNFENEYYAPQLSEPLSALAEKRKTTEEDLERQLAPLRAKLLRVRDRRPRPLTDTKILTAWNGLMIRGFADAGRIFQEPKYLDAAAKAAEFVLAELRTELKEG